MQNKAVNVAETVRISFDEFLHSLATMVVAEGFDRFTTENVAEIERRRALLRIEEAADEATAARDVAIESARQSQQAAGVAGTAGLSQHFKERADVEARSANLFRLAVIADLLIVVVVAAAWAYFLADNSENLLASLPRLAVTIPLGLLALYMSREAAQHRTRSVWSRNVEIQLRTLEAYTAPLGEVDRSRIRAEFGDRLFRAGVGEVDANQPTSLPQLGELIAAVSELVSKVGELMRPSPER